MSINEADKVEILEHDWISKKIKELNRKNNPYFLAIGDIDFFVNVDMKVGKEEGDKILGRIHNYFKKEWDGYIGRYGGDEFLFIFENRTKEEIITYMEIFRDKIKRKKFISVHLPYHKVPFSLSYGICSSIHGTENILKKAEIAMSMAKKQGRKRFVFYNGGEINVMESDTKAAVTTICGAGLRGYSKDGTCTGYTSLSEPYSIYHFKNAIIIADRGRHVIRKIENGMIITVAGTGEYGYVDSCRADKARLNKPNGIAVNKEGELFIADTGNHCIRKVDKNGKISTILGNGAEGRGRLGQKGTDYGLSRPGGVAVDLKGNVYTNDYGNNRIVKLNVKGNAMSVIGTGEFGSDSFITTPAKAKLNKPYGLAVNLEGSLIIVADYDSHTIRVADMGKNQISEIRNLNQTLENPIAPFWVSLHQDKILFVADAGNHCILIYDMENRLPLGKIGGNNPGFQDGNEIRNVKFNTPAGMCCDETLTYLYIVDYANNAIRKVDLNFFMKTTVNTKAGTKLIHI